MIAIDYMIYFSIRPPEMSMAKWLRRRRIVILDTTLASGPAGTMIMTWRATHRQHE